MLNEADNFADIFRGGLPYCLLVALPILILCTPTCLASEFQVMSMTKFDINGEQLGARSSAISLEAKSLYTWSTGRHCVLARLLDISVNDLNKVRQKAGGLIVMLPKDVPTLTDEVKEHILLLEQQMIAQSIPVPVYFAPFNIKLEHIINDVTHTTTNIDNNATNRTAFGQLMLTVAANGYHVTVDGQNSAANKNSKIPVIQGEFVPNQFVKHGDNSGDGKSLPLILITANLKTFGITNDYPVNTDSAVIMALIEVFSKLHSMISTSPKYRLGFLLSDSGLLLNFQGSKKWLEMDDNMSLQNVELVLCLDTIIQSLASNQADILYMHVSKPPKEKSSISNFFKLLKTVAGHHANLTVEGVHKKINLADAKLSWEHERFCMKRYPAFTLSSVKNPGSPFRTTMFKDDEAHIVTQSMNSLKIIAEALACYMYKIDPASDVFEGHVIINEDNILPYLGLKSLLQNNDIKDGFEKYLKNVKIIYDKPDVRDPDFMFYNGIDAKLNVYRVKPAIFDLFLTIVISLYLTTVYFAIQFFPRFYEVISSNSDPIRSFIGNSQNALKRK